MPGSLASCWTRRAMGEANTSAPEEPRRQRQPARGPPELGLGQLARALEREVDGAHREVLDHAAISHDGRIDRERHDLAPAVGDAADEPAARLGGDRLLAERVAHLRHLVLDAPGGLEEAFDVGYRHHSTVS